jgi:perosamine synthetase
MRLAIHGGKKERTRLFPAQPGPDQSYSDIVDIVLFSRVLSGYRGNSSLAFWGGQWVQKFEETVDKYFGGFAIACNSATSGLWMACAAIGLQPGDEVIVTPWSMSCSATVPLLFGAIPVFADIDTDTFCLDPVDVAKKITKRTRAIIVVDLFGQVFDPRINEIAEEHGLIVIEDAAQAIGARRMDGYREKEFAGLCGDVGVFSFTQGKHLTAGEGGCCVTKNKTFAQRLAMVRNHAEAVHKDNHINFPAWGSCVGLNLRMTEIQAAILLKEFSRLGSYIKKRREICEVIQNTVHPFDCRVAKAAHGTHAYYVCPIVLSEELAPRAKQIAAALREELMPDEVRIDRGVPVAHGYIDPLYLMPLFQEEQHWAFGLQENKGHSGVYKKGTCPMAESYTESGLVITLLHGLALDDSDVKDVCDAFHKVFSKYSKYAQEGIDDGISAE